MKMVGNRMSVFPYRVSLHEQLGDGADVDGQTRLARAIDGVASLVMTGAVAVTNGMRARADGRKRRWVSSSA
ncbi:MAG TPA: hypothetical protein VGV14_00105 [Rhodanobacter sp.]|nr:hypothetical protein [Rhodanobacter sp.]